MITFTVGQLVAVILVFLLCVWATWAITNHRLKHMLIEQKDDLNVRHLNELNEVCKERNNYRLHVRAFDQALMAVKDFLDKKCDEESLRDVLNALQREAKHDSHHLELVTIRDLEYKLSAAQCELRLASGERDAIRTKQAAVGLMVRKAFAVPDFKNAELHHTLLELNKMV